jgi:hypothetical protein
MLPWIKVVTHPLGLIGFALFLVFSFLAKNRQKKKPTWLPSVAFVMAFATLVGGFGLAYVQTGRPTPAPASNEQKIGTIQQKSSGPSTSNVAGVQGNVSVSIAPQNQDSRPEVEPLKEEDLIVLLGTKVTNERIVAEIEKRGVAFEMTPDRARALRSAGASQAVIDAIEKSRKK